MANNNKKSNQPYSMYDDKKGIWCNPPMTPLDQDLISFKEFWDKELSKENSDYPQKTDYVLSPADADNTTLPMQVENEDKQLILNKIKKVDEGIKLLAQELCDDGYPKKRSISQYVEHDQKTAN